MRNKDGQLIQGKHSYFALYGERCSGTNIIAVNVTQNSRDRLTEFCPVGDKHFPPTLAAASELLVDTAVIVVVRGAVEWLRSLYAKPWHAAPELRSMDFSAFIRSEWYSVYDEHANITVNSALYGTELMADRDPFSGKRFNNVLQMRARKLELMLQLLDLSDRSCVVRLEDYVKSPATCLEGLFKKTRIEYAQPIQVNRYYKGRASWKRKVLSAIGLGQYLPPPESARPKPTVSQADLDFIWSQLDLGLEERLGYQPEC